MAKINVLLIDDEKKFCETFQEEYDGDEFAIDYALSLEKAQQMLESNFLNYHFVILDGLGATSSFDERIEARGRGETNFAMDAIQYLKAKEVYFGRIMPFCILTGWPDVVSYVKNQAEIFIKAKGDTERQRLLNYIRSQYNSLEEITIQKRHTTVFEVFERGLLSEEKKRLLIKLFKDLEAAEPMQQKAVVSQIRPMVEAVYLKMAEWDAKLIPNGLAQGNEQSLGQAIWYMAGSPSFNKPHRKMEFRNVALMPLNLFYYVEALNKAVSRTVMHDDKEPISKYAAQCYTNTLCDLLLWFRNIADKHGR